MYKIRADEWLSLVYTRMTTHDTDLTINLHVLLGKTCYIHELLMLDNFRVPADVLF